MKELLKARAGAALLAMSIVIGTGMPLSAQDRGYSEEFSASARAWLLDNPGIMLEVFTLLEHEEMARKTVAARELIASHAEALFKSDDPRMGNPDGPVVLVEFFDYACGYCRAALPELTAVLDDRDDVAVVLKEFPILGPASEQAARLALAIRAEHGDEAYLGFHNALLVQNGALNQASLEVLVGAAGLDFEALERRGQQEDITERIEANRSLAQALGVNGTPAFVFEDELMPGLMTRERLEEAFDRQMEAEAVR